MKNKRCPLISKVNLEHQIWKQIKSQGLQEKKMLLAVSGGVDSVALLLALSRTIKKENLGVFHFHHGPGQNLKHRNSAQSFCKKICEQWGLPIFLKKSETKLKNENEMREARYKALHSCMEQNHFDVLVTAHHQDDLLETRMIRMIRGTGLKGLSGMVIFDKIIFRPLLENTKMELEKYVKTHKVSYVKDPSNDEDLYLRNWLRKHFFSALERKQKGSLRSLHRSFENIVQEGPPRNLLDKGFDKEKKSLMRLYYLSLGSREQLQILAQYLLFLNQRDYTHSQLTEIKKRLDNPQKEYTFKVGSCSWFINAEQIQVQL